jgi:hypothetical protein
MPGRISNCIPRTVSFRLFLHNIKYMTGNIELSAVPLPNDVVAAEIWLGLGRPIRGCYS